MKRVARLLCQKSLEHPILSIGFLLSGLSSSRSSARSSHRRNHHSHDFVSHSRVLFVILVLMAALLTFNVGAGNPAVATPLMSSLVLTAPTLGNYGNTPVSLSADATVTPDAAPTNVTSINVSTSTNFKGTFVASSTTGVVRVTNAHPAGTYPVTVRASGDGGLEVTRTFTLTVQVGTACTGVPAFTHSADVAIGPSSREVAIGDFNNDGKQDLAVANGISTGIVSIRLGDGVGGFSGTTSISVGTFPFSVAIGDFNNDGKQDIATANSGSDTASLFG